MKKIFLLSLLTFFVWGVYSQTGNIEQGLSFFEKQEYDKALKAFSKAIDENADVTDVYFYRANTYMALEEYEKSIEDYNFVVSHDNSNIDAVYNRGNAYYELGKYKNAINDFNVVLKKDPQFVEALQSRGSAHFNSENYKNALTDFKKAVELQPGAGTWYDLGNAHFMLGDFSASVDDFSQAIEHDSANSDYFFNRALSYFYLEIYSEGCKDLEQAAILGDKEAEGYFDELCKDQF